MNLETTIKYQQTLLSVIPSCLPILRHLFIQILLSYAYLSLTYSFTPKNMKFQPLKQETYCAILADCSII